MRQAGAKTKRPSLAIFYDSGLRLLHGGGSDAVYVSALPQQVFRESSRQRHNRAFPGSCGIRSWPAGCRQDVRRVPSALRCNSVGRGCFGARSRCCQHGDTCSQSASFRKPCPPPSRVDPGEHWISRLGASDLELGGSVADQGAFPAQDRSGIGIAETQRPAGSSRLRSDYPSFGSFGNRGGASATGFGHGECRPQGQDG